MTYNFFLCKWLKGIPGDTWSGINGIDDSIFPVHHVIDYIRQYESPGIN